MRRGGDRAAAGWQKHAPVASTYYVSTAGASGNAGTIASPWDLGSVLAGSHPQLNAPAAGATVYWRGGTYSGSWTLSSSALSGTNPNGAFDPRGKIHMRAYPGETVVLTDTLTIDSTAGTDIWWWDLEVKNTNASSSDTIGVDCHAARHGFIRVISHDHSGDGFGGWIENPDCFWVQCAGYNNGFTGSTPGVTFGHNYYIENQTGFKRVYGSIGFNAFGYNFHHYASGASFLTGGDFRSCGATAAGRGNPGNSGYNFLLGGGPPLVNLNADSLMAMAPQAASESTTASIGYFSDQTVNTSATITNCFFDGKLLLEWWDSPAVLTFTGNAVGDGLTLDLLGASASLNASSVLNGNVYNYVDAFDPFALGKNQVYSVADTIAAWRTLLGGSQESTSTLTANATMGQKIVVYANPLDAGNGLVLIKNSAGASTVSVDVSSILSNGANYAVYHHHSLNASSVLTGTYAGGTLAFPMNPSMSPPPMLGGSLRSATPVDSRPYAGMFWVKTT